MFESKKCWYLVYYHKSSAPEDRKRTYVCAMSGSEAAIMAKEKLKDFLKEPFEIELIRAI